MGTQSGISIQSCCIHVQRPTKPASPLAKGKMGVIASALHKSEEPNAPATCAELWGLPVNRCSHHTTGKTLATQINVGRAPPQLHTTMLIRYTRVSVIPTRQTRRNELHHESTKHFEKTTNSNQSRLYERRHLKDQTLNRRITILFPELSSKRNSSSDFQTQAKYMTIRWSIISYHYHSQCITTPRRHNQILYIAFSKSFKKGARS